MAAHNRRGNSGRQQYSGLSQDDYEHELNPTDPEQPDSPGLLHHHRLHPLRGGVHTEPSDISPAGSSPDDNGYGAAHKDFERHYRGSAAPEWKRSPTFRSDELQTYYESMGENAQTQLARNHDPQKQFVHLLGKVLLRWLASFILAAMMVVAFYEYEKVKILNTTSKRWFNAVSTGLYLTLGLNLAASLKGMAIIVRWKLLARKRHQLEEVDFILGLSSLIKVFRYGFHVAKSRPWTSAACFGWIFFNAVGRLSVALTGLTYSYDSAGAASLHPGLVNITNWETFSEHDAVSRSIVSTPVSERYSAHSYGLFSVILEYQPLTNPGESDPNTPLDRPIEVAPDRSWVYYMREFNPDTTNPHSNLPHKSERYIGVSGTCEYFPLVEGQYGNSSTVAYMNGTTRHELDGISDYGPAATTWINPRSDLPQNSDWACGPRCSSLAALQFLDSDDVGPGAFYDCEVRVSTVQGATDPVHQVTDEVAFIVAGSIGLEGYSTGPDQWEYVRYTPDSPWSGFNVGELESDASYMASLASRFAIGAVATKDLFGSTTAQAQGQTAWIGVLLKVKWNFLLLILGTILVVQLLVALAIVMYANTVFCKDDSYLSTARLLRPIVERLGPNGCAITGKDIANTLREFMIYGVRTDDSGERHHLDLGENIPRMRRFPTGWYDGFEEWVDVGNDLVNDLDTSVQVKKSAGVGKGRVRRRITAFGTKRKAPRA